MRARWLSRHPLVVETTPLLGELLQLAFARRRLSPDLLVFRRPAVPEDERRAPSAVFIQQGGMRALERLGVDTVALSERGFAVSSLLLIDSEGRELVEYAPTLSSCGPDPVWAALPDVREIVAKTVASTGLSSRYDAGAGELDASGWTGIPSPGIMLRRATGRLVRPGRHLVWDGPGAHVGLTQLDAGTLFAYAVPRVVAPKDDERRVCLDALDAVPWRLDRHIADLGAVVEDQWFPLERLGYRSCQGTGVLRWGPGALRLHPLTGQHLSYWSIQALRLADEVARTGWPSPRFLAALDRDGRAVYRRHLRSMAFYLRPSLFWRVLFRPYAWALGRSQFLTRRAVARVALLDLDGTGP